MKITELRELLKNKEVAEEINKHLWIESQKAGYSIGIERATDEWIRLYAEGWLKFNKPDKYRKLRSKKPAKKSTKNKRKTAAKKKPAKRKAAKKKANKVRKPAKKKTQTRSRKKKR